MIIPTANRARSSEASHPPRRRTPWCALLVAAAVGAAALPGASQAQPSLGEPPAPTRVDQRWLPWLGCWQLVEEAGALPDSSGDLPAFANRVLVCVTPPAGPAPATDVLVTTLAGGERVLQETLSADGREHAVDQSECRGRRRIAWSGDGARLFTRARLTCNDREDARRVSGVGLMADSRTWLAIELVEAGQSAAVMVRRYRRAGDVATLGAAGPALTPDLLARARTAANQARAAGLTIDAVIEAGTRVEAPVLEALLVETGTILDLDGRTLIQLDDGGVPDDVIDLLVALSFPDDFSVQRSSGSAGSYGGGGGFLGTWSGYGYDSWYPYYAAPFGYYYGWSPYRSLYGWGDYYYVPGGFDDPGPADGPADGRMLGGYGYTRTATGREDGGRRAQPRGTGVAAASGGGSSSAPRATGGSAGGGRVSSGGWSGGRSSGGGRSASSGGGRSASSGGGSSSGRTATRRDP